jgi:hypothetical protein
MNTKTTIQTQNPNIQSTKTDSPDIIMSMMKYGIVIKGEDRRVVKIMATPYLGRLYTYVEFLSANNEEVYMPVIRGILPAWVWRRVKKMIARGTDIRQIEQYVFYATKEFIAINVTDKHFNNEARIYYEEPYRLLTHFFSLLSHDGSEKRNLFNNHPRVFKCICGKS